MSETPSQPRPDDSAARDVLFTLHQELMNLHPSDDAAVMSILRAGIPACDDPAVRRLLSAYRVGNRDARHAAVELVQSHPALLALVARLRVAERGFDAWWDARQSESLWKRAAANGTDVSLAIADALMKSAAKAAWVASRAANEGEAAAKAVAAPAGADAE